MEIRIETASNTRSGHKEAFFVRLEVNGRLVAKTYAPTEQMGTRMALVLLAKAYEANILGELGEPEKDKDPEPQEEAANTIEDVLDALTGLDKWMEDSGGEGGNEKK